MRAVRDGDVSRLGVLFERYHLALFDFLSRMTGNAGVAEDLVQDVFVRVLKYRATFRDEGRFETWISTNANESVELVVTVPTRTNLKVSGTNGGMLTIEGVDGDIEANNTNNSITLTNVAGSVVAHSTNGHIKATLTRVTMQKPMAFTSFNGNIDVTLASSLKATFKLRSDMGEIYTDFDLQLRTDTTTSQPPQRQNGELRIVVNKSLSGTLNGGGPEVELAHLQRQHLPAQGRAVGRRAGQSERSGARRVLIFERCPTCPIRGTRDVPRDVASDPRENSRVSQLRDRT